MKTILAMNAEEKGGPVIGYMCATDWECELGLASGGNTIFPSKEDAINRLKCAEGCGIVEVEVRFRRLVLAGKSPVAATLETLEDMT